MQAAQDGDSAAYHQLLTEVAKPLNQYFFVRLRQREVSEDLVQETLISVHHSMATYDPKRSFTGWLYGIAHHKFVDFLRKQERTTGKNVNDETIFERFCNEDFGIPIDLEADLQEALESLSPKQREAVELLKIEGLSSKESAQRMGISLSALKVNAHRAYQSMRKFLGERGR